MSNPPSSSPIARGYALLVAIATKFQCPLLLLIRLYWGWGFFMTGKGKLGAHEKTAEYFASLHIPHPSMSAWMAGATECFGGLLLLIGLASRLTTIPLIATMIVAYLTAESESAHAIFSDPEAFMKADPFLFLFACLIIFAFGPGRLSVDYLLSRRFGPRRD